MGYFLTMKDGGEDTATSGGGDWWSNIPWGDITSTITELFGGSAAGEDERFQELKTTVRGKNWPANLTGGIGVNNYTTFSAQRVADAVAIVTARLQRMASDIESGNYTGPKRVQERYLRVYTEILTEMAAWVDSQVAAGVNVNQPASGSSSSGVSSLLPWAIGATILSKVI